METKNPTERVVIDLKSIWSPHDEKRASPNLLPEYTQAVLAKADEEISRKAAPIVLTGAAPNWLYVAAALAAITSGKCRELVYNSPTTGDIIVWSA